MIAFAAQIALLLWSIIACPVMVVRMVDRLPTIEDGGGLTVGIAIAYVRLWFWPALALVALYLLAVIAERAEAIRKQRDQPAP